MMKNKFFNKILCGILCTAMTLIPAASAFAAEYDETGAPIVTATPTPIPHTEYYNQPAETDSIPDWPQGPKIEGESAVLMDMTTGTVLYSKNADKVQFPASITKIMTSFLAAEHLDMNGKIVMSENAAHNITISDSSSIYADTGEEFTMEQAMMAVMLQSANEMTLALAEETSGSVKKFVELMNEKARSLGCSGTHFNNPHGLPDDLHYTTAGDMAKIARAAWYNPTFRKYATTVYYEIPKTNIFPETRYLLNHHKMMKGNTYAYDGVLGGKTGYTDAAGNTLVTYASKGSMRLVAVVMQSIGGAYADTAALLDYGFNNFTRTAVKSNPSEISVSCLPSEQYLVKDFQNCPLFTMPQTPSVVLPNGVDVSKVSESRSFKKNSVGLPLLEITYTYNGQKTGTARYYQTSLLSDLLL